MVEFEELEEEYRKFTKLLKKFTDEGWWDIDYVLEQLSSRVIKERLKNGN